MNKLQTFILAASTALTALGQQNPGLVHNKDAKNSNDVTHTVKVTYGDNNKIKQVSDVAMKADSTVTEYSRLNFNDDGSIKALYTSEGADFFTTHGGYFAAGEGGNASMVVDSATKAQMEKRAELITMLAESMPHQPGQTLTVVDPHVKESFMRNIQKVSKEGHNGQQNFEPVVRKPALGATQ
jgi:hypothetical protein